MKVHYLEIITPEVETLCKTYAQLHGISFGETDPILGGARVAELDGGGLIGIRPPMRETESPTVRHYTLVEDIQKTVSEAEKIGALIALPPMELPGRGICAIVIHAGIESGYWQL